jgi:hypothetical protein
MSRTVSFKLERASKSGPTLQKPVAFTTAMFNSLHFSVRSWDSALKGLLLESDRFRTLLQGDNLQGALERLLSVTYRQ